MGNNGWLSYFSDLDQMGDRPRPARRAVLQILPIKVVTSANATGATWLRMYWHTTSLGTAGYPDLPHRSNRYVAGFVSHTTHVPHVLHRPPRV
jgi:hypothetical protein